MRRAQGRAGDSKSWRERKGEGTNKRWGVNGDKNRIRRRKRKLKGWPIGAARDRLSSEVKLRRDRKGEIRRRRGGLGRGGGGKRWGWKGAGGVGARGGWGAGTGGGGGGAWPYGVFPVFQGEIARKEKKEEDGEGRQEDRNVRCRKGVRARDACTSRTSAGVTKSIGGRGRRRRSTTSRRVKTLTKPEQKAFDCTAFQGSSPFFLSLLSSPFSIFFLLPPHPSSPPPPPPPFLPPSFFSLPLSPLLLSSFFPTLPESRQRNCAGLWYSISKEEIAQTPADAVKIAKKIGSRSSQKSSVPRSCTSRTSAEWC